MHETTYFHIASIPVSGAIEGQLIQKLAEYELDHQEVRQRGAGGLQAQVGIAMRAGQCPLAKEEVICQLCAYLKCMIYLRFAAQNTINYYHEVKALLLIHYW